MSTSRDAICKEIELRVEKTRAMIETRGYDALVVFGDNKVCGSLRYLTDYFPDRAGWISTGPHETYLFEGAAFVLPLKGEPVLMLDPGLMPGKEICVEKLSAGGFSVAEGVGLSGRNIAAYLSGTKEPKRIGIETYDRFPLPLYLELKEALPGAELERSTIVEELRMIKSPFELGLMKKAAEVADEGSQTVFELLKDGIGRTELEIIRAAEHTMRMKDPIYEDSCTGSPSLICSGTSIRGSMLHLPDAAKKIEKGDAVHWDICLRYEGYPIDTSRTRVVGEPTDEQKRAYDVSLRMHEAVLNAAVPGAKASDLVLLADKVAREGGLRLWDDFLGHGLGLDTHERPDLVVEETLLAENMVLAIEPRVTPDDSYIFGIEDMVVITNEGGVPLTKFPWRPLGISQ
jgi:Xaa-Pro aminopeptidase